MTWCFFSLIKYYLVDNNQLIERGNWKFKDTDINVGILVLSLPGARKVHEDRNTISFGGKGALYKWCPKQPSGECLVKGTLTSG